MKKKTFLRNLSFSSLALLMGIAGTMVFAPLGASPSVANASEMVESTTEQGLITPKADDPVIYTTESGLEIKWGNAAPSTLKPTLSSGNLTGFPYFTTTANSTTYTWVIIGKNPDLKVGGVDISRLFSTWKSLDAKYKTYGNYFFNNIYETSTPAGSAINAVIPSKTYVADLTSNSEIPSGCVLVVANDGLEQGVYNTAVLAGSALYTHNGTIISGHPECYNPTYSGNEQIVMKMKSYYDNGSFGLSSVKSNIQKIDTLYTFTKIRSNAISGTQMPYVRCDYDNAYIYPLACYEDSHFYFGRYLSGTQAYTTNVSWLRGLVAGDTDSPYYDTNYRQPYYFGASVTWNNGAGGANGYNYVRVASNWYRPAFCLKIT